MTTSFLPKAFFFSFLLFFFCSIITTAAFLQDAYYYWLSFIVSDVRLQRHGFLKDEDM